MANADLLPIVKFKPVSSEKLCVTTDDLSTDQQYMMRIYNAVMDGYVDETLAVRDPGNISHSRRLTCVNRFLRLYVSTGNPSEELVRIVHYIMKCYIPTWFSIKCNESIVNGSRNLYGLIARLRFVDEVTQEITCPVVQHNGYFAHSECILLSMLADDDKNMRKLACARIKKSRQSENSG